MTLSYDTANISIGLNSVPTLDGGGGSYRVGDAAVFVSGNRVAAINDDGPLFQAIEYVDGSGLGLGRIIPYHVHDNGNGTFGLYYQVYDADPLPANYTNWLATLDVTTGVATGPATQFTTGPFSITNGKMMSFAADLPDGNIFLVANTTQIVTPTGDVIATLPPVGGIGVTTVGHHPRDLTVSGDKIFYAWVDSSFGEAAATYMQIYNTDGTQFMAPFEVSDDSNGDFGKPPSVQLETLSNGQVVAVWVDPGTQAADTDETSVWFKIYNADGTLAVDSTLVNAGVTHDRQDTPLLFATESGFVIGYSILTFSAPFLQEGRLQEYDNAGTLIDTFEGAYTWGSANAVRTDNNTAIILDGDANELILSGADTALPSPPPAGLALTGDDSANTLTGDAGADTIVAARGNDTIDGNDGDDDIRGDGGDDTIYGGAGNDTIRGGRESDSILGGDGNDVIRGQKNADFADGGAGDDNIKGGGGNDTLLGGEGNDFLKGGTRRDSLEGGEGNDKLFGNSFDDVLRGGDGHDTLNGGGDNDTLEGGVGLDFLKGGSGADVFEFDTGHEADVISDFDTAEDILQLSLALAGGQTATQIADTAQINAFGAVLDFGNGDSILLRELTDLTDLAAAIDIV